MNGIQRWRIDRSVARITLAGLVNVLGLFFAAGWLVGAHMLRPAAEEVTVPVVPTVIAETSARENPLSEEPLPLRRDKAERQESRQPASTWVPTWSAPSWSAAVSNASYRDLIRDAALHHSISPSLVEAMARVESGLNPAAVSRKGARGLLQVLPATARRFGFSADQLLDPEHNLAAGTTYMAWLLDRYRNLDLALAAYNAGEGAVDDHGGIPPYPETQEYVRRVKAALLGFEPSTDQRMLGENGWQPFGSEETLPLEDDVESSLPDTPPEKADQSFVAVEETLGEHGIAQLGHTTPSLICAEELGWLSGRAVTTRY
jgi:hypothetical protein